MSLNFGRVPRYWEIGEIIGSTVHLLQLQGLQSFSLCKLDDHTSLDNLAGQPVLSQAVQCIS